MSPRFLILATLLSLGACAHPVEHTGASSSAPSAVPKAVQSARPTARPTPTAAPSPTPAPQPIATPTPTSTPEVLAPDAPPRIISHALSATHVHSGQIVSGVVVTSSNVASLTATMVGQTLSVPKVGVGRFALAYRVPQLPAFVHGTFALTLTARNTAGSTVSETIPITLD